MPGIRETRQMPYSAEQMFDLVADVARYAEFLPWVVGTRVRSDSETEMTADMLVGFNAFREKFTSRVEKIRPIAEGLGCTMAQLAVAWCASNPKVTTVITGASKVSQVVDNFGALDVLEALTPEIIEQINAAVAV